MAGAEHLNTQKNGLHSKALQCNWEERRPNIIRGQVSLDNRNVSHRTTDFLRIRGWACRIMTPKCAILVWGVFIAEDSRGATGSEELFTFRVTS